MDFPHFLGVLGGILFAAAFCPYVFTIIFSSTRPNRAGWLIWSVNGSLLAASYLKTSEHRDAKWLAIATAVGPFAVFLLALFKGEKGHTKLDTFCLAAVGVLLCTLLLGLPIVSYIGTLVVDLLGALPTMRKAYKDPRSENRLSWSLWFSGSLLSLLAVRELSFAALVLPVYYTIGAGMIFSFTVFRPRTVAESR